jgi:hypothetical protein
VMREPAAGPAHEMTVDEREHGAGVVHGGGHGGRGWEKGLHAGDARATA